MNTMAAARVVPLEIKEQGDLILKKLESNPTELINKAYAYVLKNGSLPGEDDAQRKNVDIKRTIPPELIQDLHAVYEEMSLSLADAWSGKNSREIHDELEDDRYARFA